MKTVGGNFYPVVKEATKLLLYVTCLCTLLSVHKPSLRRGNNIFVVVSCLAPLLWQLFTNICVGFSPRWLIPPWNYGQYLQCLPST